MADMYATQTALDLHLRAHAEDLRRARQRWFRFRAGRSPARHEVALAA